jgi:CRISPR/Cas system-associated endonuclease/helicase Cas3
MNARQLKKKANMYRDSALQALSSYKNTNSELCYHIYKRDFDRAMKIYQQLAEHYAQQEYALTFGKGCR